MARKRVLLWDWTNTDGPGNAGVPWMMDQVNFQAISAVSNWNTWVPPELKGRAAFRPMVRTLNELNGQDWQNVLNTQESIIHFFNEPERGGISPEQAADLWRQKMMPLRDQRGKKLVSPSCANDQAGQDWINKWLSLVGDCPPDYLGLHYYGPDGGPMKDFLQSMHNQHPQLPVVVSEWACISRDYNAVLNMTLDLLGWMDSQDWIFEHGLFCCERAVDAFVGPAAKLMNPDGSFTDLFQKYQAGNGSSSGTSIWIVKAGDTFWSISQALGTNPEAIEALNPGVSPQSLFIGQKLNIPGGGLPRAALTNADRKVLTKDGAGQVPIKASSSPLNPKPVNAAQRVLLFDPSSPVTKLARPGNWTIQQGGKTWTIPNIHGISLQTFKAENTAASQTNFPTNVFRVAAASTTGVASATEYVVKSGDTFWSISQAFGLDVVSLQAANPGINPSDLQVGQSINIPGSGGSSYTIKAGDTLWSIAQAVNTTIESIEAANPGLDPTNLVVGSSINLPVGGPVAPPQNPPPGDGKVAYSGSASNFPDPNVWASWDTLWNQNTRLLQFHNANDRIDMIKQSISIVASESGVDNRAILCTIIQESGGDPTIVGTVSPDGVRNPGLMQSHNGASFNPQDPAGSILQMIRDGTEGTKDGPGLKQLLAQYGNYYCAFRAYNSGSVDQNDLNNAFGATPSYVSDIANRLMGHEWPGM